MKVYLCEPADVDYHGFALIGANSAEEANQYIDDLKRKDPENKYDSFGYSHVSEHDIIYDVFTEKAGIIESSIFQSWKI